MLDDTNKIKSYWNFDVSVVTKLLMCRQGRL